MTAHETFEALAVSELHVQLAAVPLHQAEGIELAGVALVGKSSEMTPVDFEALSRAGLHAHVGTLGAADAVARELHFLADLFSDPAHLPS